jgi:hypothetical protein
MDDTAHSAVLVERRAARSRARRVAVGVVAVGVIAVWWWGYRTGESQSPVRWHTGTAYSVDAQIAAQVDGWVYSIPLDVQWEDQTGTWHLGDRPECLPPTGNIASVRFAEVGFKLRDTGFRQVVFVSCKR